MNEYNHLNYTIERYCYILTSKLLAKTGSQSNKSNKNYRNGAMPVVYFNKSR